MANLIILWLTGFQLWLAVCDAGLIPDHVVHPDFPQLKTVDHGHGATSYQNVDVQDFGSVPIPKDLQVDDGHEYLHTQYLHNDVEDTHEISSLGLQSYADEHELEHENEYVVSSEDPYIFEEHGEQEVQEEQEDHLELQPEQAYSQNSYEHYDHESEYEYH